MKDNSQLLGLSQGRLTNGLRDGDVGLTHDSPDGLDKHTADDDAVSHRSHHSPGHSLHRGQYFAAANRCHSCSLRRGLHASVCVMSLAPCNSHCKALCHDLSIVQSMQGCVDQTDEWQAGGLSYSRDP
jgi:hypothetical protein